MVTPKERPQRLSVSLGAQRRGLFFFATIFFGGGFKAAQQQAAAAARILCGVPGYVIKGSSLRKCRSLRLIRKENRNSRWHTVCFLRLLPVQRNSVIHRALFRRRWRAKTPSYW